MEISIEALLAAMTLQEKIGQLNMVPAPGAVTGPQALQEIHAGVRSGSIGSLLNLWGAEEARAIQRLAVEESRLGIPLLLGLDVIHGHRTIFPVPLAEACAFAPDLWERTARAAAEEAAAEGIAMTFAPMVDVARDPRWGRIVESPGEDPWVASEVARAKTRGFQGANLAAAGSLAATAKHFCAYGAVTAGREYASVDVSERSLRETYLPPFAAAIAAGASALMPAFVDIAGQPMHANARLLREWLRDRLGFDGVVVSDYNALAELMTHGVAKDAVEAAALALRAGVDIDMTSGTYAQGLPEALASGLVSMSAIDTSVRRVLTLKARLGLIDDPYRRGAASEAGAEPDHKELAREAARRSIVLLTHRGVLPLPPDIRRIALVGPLAAASAEMLGSWALAGDPRKPVSFLDGLRHALPRCRIDHAAGVGVEDDDERGVPAAVDLCHDAEAVVLCIGESAAMSGEAASRAGLGLPGKQRMLAEAVLNVGKPVVALLSCGRPLALPWLFERADAALATFFLGDEAGNAVADVLTGRFNPSGRLAATWPRHGGQSPLFYGQRPSGRPAAPGVHYSSTYLDVSPSPQFPFGHGLSYGRFTLSDLRCAPSRLKRGESLEVSVAVFNDGEADGEATLFLFIRDVVASVARPLLELKGVRKVPLAAKERRQAAWRLSTEELAFIGSDLEPVVEPDRFEIHVGQSADPAGLLTGVIELEPW